MEVTLVRGGKPRKLRLARPGKARISDVLADGGLNGETMFCKLNGRLAHPGERLKEGDVLELVEIIYGG